MTSAAAALPTHHPGCTGRRALLTNPEDAQAAADALARGGVIGHGFANFYVLTTRPDRDTVRRVNLMKGRAPDQVGSITTTPARIPLVYDWSRLPAGLTRHRILGLIDALFARGPFGLRGPAAAHLPGHLTQLDAGMRTAQVIAPGYACPCTAFLAGSLDAIGADILYITSANRSRHRTGAEDEPAHWTAVGLCAEFGHEPGFRLLEHADEDAARRRYPGYAPMSTTILAFHKTAGITAEGRVRLLVERHGSLGIGELRPVLAGLGFELTLAPGAERRLRQRDYGCGLPAGLPAGMSG
ncbi:MAG: hypothetical protein ACRDRV_16935 [Pseudonocardiaceae bacterium]